MVVVPARIPVVVRLVVCNVAVIAKVPEEFRFGRREKKIQQLDCAGSTIKITTNTLQK